MSTSIPRVLLSIAGHDPCGGAGIQADIETGVALGCHVATAITCLTVQDTLNVQQLTSMDPHLVEQQAVAVLEDLTVAAIKIGLIGNADVARAICRVLRRRPHIPVILDPVLAAGGGRELAAESMLRVIRKELMPLVTLITPNIPEARKLTGQTDPAAAAAALLAMGCRHVLITGTHEERPDVVHRWFGSGGEQEEWSWPRLAGSYHGSGCTLASAAAARLAQGAPMREALQDAQSFTWQALEAGYRVGRGQTIPRRSMPCSSDGGSSARTGQLEVQP